MFQYLKETEDGFLDVIEHLNDENDLCINLFGEVINGVFYQNFGKYLINKVSILFQLFSPFTYSVFYPFMKENLIQDFLCILGIFLIPYAILNKQAKLIEALNIPILLVLGVVDLCFNVTVLALSLITRSIATLYWMAAFQLNPSTDIDQTTNFAY